MPAKAPTSEWIEKLAVHLASEEAFIDYMKNPGDPADIIIPQPWLATIYLPGRTHFYNEFPVCIHEFHVHEDALTEAAEMVRKLVEQRQRPQT